MDARICSGSYSRRVSPNLQLADPEIRGSFDTDEALALQTRRAFVARRIDNDAPVFLSHFSTSTGGHVVSDGDGCRATPAERVLGAEEVQ